MSKITTSLFLMNFRFLKIVRTPDAELVELLNDNIIGTPGQGMLYQHLTVKNKLDHLENPYYVNLVRSGRIIGTCCFCHRETINNGHKIKSFYIRYFSFKDVFRRKSNQEKSRSGISVLRKEVESVLAGQGLDVKPDEKFFHYAYVDPRNVRSALLCREFGFEPIRQYTTVLFSRFNPTINEQVIESPSPASMKTLLSSFYYGFNTLSFENITGRKYYTIQNDQGQVVAGVQVNPDQWKIHALPGLTGLLTLQVLSRMPLLNRLFNKHFRFLTLEALYVQPGYEKHLERLFETLLAKYKLHAAICMIDPSSDLYTVLKSMNLGLLNTLNKEVRGHVICKFYNFSEAEKNEFKTRPAYISGIDAT